MAEEKKKPVGFNKATKGRKPPEINQIPKGINDPPPAVIRLSDRVK